MDLSKDFLTLQRLLLLLLLLQGLYQLFQGQDLLILKQ